MYEIIKNKIEAKEQLTNEEYKFIRNEFCIYDEELDDTNVKLIIVDLEEVLYAFKVDESQKEFVYLDHPYRVIFVQKNDAIYIVEHILH